MPLFSLEQDWKNPPNSDTAVLCTGPLFTSDHAAETLRINKEGPSPPFLLKLNVNGSPCRTLRVSRSCLDLRTTNRQELSHRKAATGAQGYPDSWQSLPAVVDALEAVRSLEEPIWDVYPSFRHF